MDWTDLCIGAPFVLLLGAFLFHCGGWYHRLQHVLEHGHAVPFDVQKEMIEPTLSKEPSCPSLTPSTPQSPTELTPR